MPLIVVIWFYHLSQRPLNYSVNLMPPSGLIDDDGVDQVVTYGEFNLIQRLIGSY